MRKTLLFPLCASLTIAACSQEIPGENGRLATIETDPRNSARNLILTQDGQEVLRAHNVPASWAKKAAESFAQQGTVTPLVSAWQCKTGPYEAAVTMEGLNTRLVLSHDGEIISSESNGVLVKKIKVTAAHCNKGLPIQPEPQGQD